MTTGRAAPAGRSLEIPPHGRVRVATPDGVGIAAQVWEPRQRAGTDLLFIHGFSQSHLAWLRQVQGPLREHHRLVTYDLRGHGDSDQPHDPVRYQSPRHWADEVQAVIEQTQLDRPVVVAWSYGGRVLLDYLAAYGDADIAGIAMVCATSSTDPAFSGPEARWLRAMGDADPATSEAATRALLAACTAAPLPAEEFAFMLRYNDRVPADIRRMLRRPTAHYESVLRSVRRPALVVHGEQDRIALPAMAHWTASRLADCRLHVYAEAAHMPFWECAQRFDADLTRFLAPLAR